MASWYDAPSRRSGGSLGTSGHGRPHVRLGRALAASGSPRYGSDAASLCTVGAAHGRGLGSRFGVPIGGGELRR